MSTRFDRTYKSWCSMIQRCCNSNHKKFRYWGGRGVTVCERWRKYDNFLGDMGARPPEKSLDRWPDKNGNYEPGNCRWATVHEQRMNCRRRENVRGTKFEPESVSRPWRARISVNGKKVHLGHFATEEQAHRAYMQARKQADA